MRNDACRFAIVKVDKGPRSGRLRTEPRSLAGIRTGYCRHSSESSNTGLRALSGLSSTADGAWASSRHWMTLHGCSLSCVPYCAMQGTDSSPGPSAWTARRSCGRERSRRACPSMLGRLPRGALVVSRLGGRSHGARRPSPSSSSTSVTRPSHSHRTRLRASAGAPRA